MRALIWSFRLFLFLVLFAFAAKNTDPVTVRLFFSATWQAPLVLVLFLFFIAGALLGVLAMSLPFFRMWRAKRQLLKLSAVHLAEPATVEPPRTGI